MRYEIPGAQAPERDVWSIGASRLRFRGTWRQTGPDRIAVLGGDAVRGRFVVDPFCKLVERGAGRACVNLGVSHAGADLFLAEEEVLSFAANSACCLVEIGGAANLSNRYFSVHPRRNDRLIAVSPALRAIYREVDFTEFHFTRHLLSRLQAICPTRFRAVEGELQRVWAARMAQLVARCGTNVVLVWLRPVGATTLGREPIFVTRPMVQQAAARARAVLELPVPRAGRNLEGMRFGPLDRPAASQMIGARGHARIAAAILEYLHA